MHDEQVRARNMVIEVDHPDFGPMRQTGNPIKFPAAEQRFAAAARLGGDSDEILGSLLGYSQERIAELTAAGAI